MLLTTKFIKENCANPDKYVQIVTYSIGKKSMVTYDKQYWLSADVLTDDILRDLYGEPSVSLFGPPNGKICGVQIWLNGDSFINYFITRPMRKKLDLYLSQQ